MRCINSSFKHACTATLWSQMPKFYPEPSSTSLLLIVSAGESSVLTVCVDALHPSQQFFIHVGTLCTKQRTKCHAQGHNTVPLLSLELTTLRSQV